MSQTEMLTAENARLAARVAELEAQLAAKPPIDRATLYRMVDHVPWGVLVVNTEGRIDYANPFFQPWLLALAPATGLPQRDVVAPGLQERLEAPLAAALQGESHEARLSLRDAQGEAREFRLTVMPRGGGDQPITGALVSLYDITETTALDRAVRENEARLTHITAVTPTVIYIYDNENGAPIWAAGRTDEVYGFSAETLIAGGGPFARDLIHPDDRPKVLARLAELAALPDGEVGEFELRIKRGGGPYRWILDRAVVFERNAAGEVTKTLSAALDIDERKRAEQRRMMLINELNHRVKNTLASVQSIARQTLRARRPAAETYELLTARLVALSAAHDVLTREDWLGAPLREVAESALRPFSAQGEARIVLDGPDLRLGPRAALAMAMALHELATNAAKYGALSVDTGRVELTWVRAADLAGPRLDLTWRERGGPPVSRPARTGFGTRLLTQGLRADLDGAADVDFAPDGVVCRITAPLEVAAQLDLG